MLSFDSSIFLPESAFTKADLDMFVNKTVVRAILYRPGQYDDKFLFHERPDWSKVAPLLRQFHGGKKEVDETPNQAVRRELKEELGLRNENSIFVGMGEFGGWLNYYFVILRTKARPIVDKSGQLHKFEERAGKKIDTKWFALDYMQLHPNEFAFNHVEAATEVARILKPTRDQI